jgi:hypothetical protein
MIIAMNQGWMTAVVDDGGPWGIFGIVGCTILTG